MSSQIIKFDEFAGSGRGLMARPIMLNDQVATKSNIASITWDVYDITVGGGGGHQSGTLDVNVVMLDSPQSWALDPGGRTFLWQAPGSLWSAPGHTYRIVVTFTQSVALGGASFIEVWEVTPKSPTAP